MKPKDKETYVEFYKRYSETETTEDIQSFWKSHKAEYIALSPYRAELATLVFEDNYESDICITDDFELSKSVPEKQMIFGWANVAIDKDGYFPFDWQDDVSFPEVLEDAVYDFVMDFGDTGEMHKGGVKGQLVESVMFTKEKMAAMGIPEGIVHEGWWIGFYIPDYEVFNKVVTGKYKMFSVGGKVKRVKI